MALGRVLGIPAFLTNKSIEDDAHLDRQIRLAKNSNSATKGQIEADVLALQKQATNAIQCLWEGRLIRRTVVSKNEKGEAIVNLPPYKTIVGLLMLQQWERDIIEEIAVRAGSKYVFELCRLRPGLPLVNRSSAANSIEKFKTRSFYMDYRLALGYAGREVEFRNMEEWQAKKGTKFDACAQICRHHLSDDNAPNIEFSDAGEMIIPSAPEVDVEAMTSSTTRILIYQEFKSQGSLLQKVVEARNHFSVSNTTTHRC